MKPPADPDDLGATASDAFGATSAAREMFAQAVVHSEIEERKFDVCNHCFQPIVYLVEWRVEKMKRTAVQAVWVAKADNEPICTDDDDGLAHGAHAPAEVPAELAPDTVRRWLDS